MSHSEEKPSNSDDTITFHCNVDINASKLLSHLRASKIEPSTKDSLETFPRDLIGQQRSEEQNLAKKGGEHGSTGDTCSTGLNDVDSEGTFVWDVDGMPLEHFEYWDPSQDTTELPKRKLYKYLSPVLPTRSKTKKPITSIEKSTIKRQTDQESKGQLRDARSTSSTPEFLYTYSGLFCVAINPYRRSVPDAGKFRAINKEKRRVRLPPYVAAIAGGYSKALDSLDSQTFKDKRLLQDPPASGDVNDNDDDTFPRYDGTNENKDDLHEPSGFFLNPVDPPASGIVNDNDDDAFPIYDGTNENKDDLHEPSDFFLNPVDLVLVKFGIKHRVPVYAFRDRLKVIFMMDCSRNDE